MTLLLLEGAGAGVPPVPVASAATQAQVAAVTFSRARVVASAATQAQAASVSLVKLSIYPVSAAATQPQVATSRLVHNLLPVTGAITTPMPTRILGCGIPRAEVWTRGGLKRVMDLPNITAVEWNRTRSDTSLGTVELDGVAIAADPACCAVMNTIRPWKHELFIYRDDKLEWCGPITEIVLEGPKLSLKARDLSAWFDRRFIHQKRTWGGTQADQGAASSQTMFMVISYDAMGSEPSPLGRPIPQLFTSLNRAGGISLDLAQRTYTPAQFKPAGPEMRDLAKGALDWTVIKRVGYVNPEKWIPVTPNPVINPTGAVDTTGWTGFTRDTTVLHGAMPASFRTAATPNVVGSMVGLTVNRNYQLRVWLRGTSSALDAAGKPNWDGVVSVGNDQSSVFSWYVYKQPLTAGAGGTDNPGRQVWVQLGVRFTATATTMPITITATGAPQDSHGIYFSEFEVWQAVSDFTLRDSALAQPVKVTLSGLDQVNRSIVANQQSGGDYAFYKEAPKPAWTLGLAGPPGALSADQLEFGLLEDITTQPLADATGAANTASAKAATLGGTPIILENLVLAPTAGVLMSDLIPGVQFTLHLEEPCFAIQSDLVLQSVSVRASTSGETVSLGFDPTGY